MQFQPNEAWENIRMLSEGEKIDMRLPSGDLVENDEENVRVFVEHF